MGFANNHQPSDYYRVHHQLSQD